MNSVSPRLCPLPWLGFLAIGIGRSITSDHLRWGAKNVETRCSRLRCPGGKVGAMPLPDAPRWPDGAVTSGPEYGAGLETRASRLYRRRKWYGGILRPEHLLGPGLRYPAETRTSDKQST